MILKVVPNTQLGHAWYCDCLYVGLRNYLVFINAKNGVFEFSFNKLLSILNKKRKINIDDISLLKELRVIKRNYRENILTELPSSEFIQKLILVFKKLNISSSTSLIESKEFQTKVEEKILRNNFNPYQKLRLVEGYYCSQNENIPDIKKIISNPQFYALKLKNDEFTLSLISKVKQHNKIPNTFVKHLSKTN